MAANITDDLFFHIFIEIENFRGEGKILMWHTHDTTFSENFFDFYQILEESEQFFILFLKKMENLGLKLKLVWPRHTNILFIFSFLFFRYSNMITFLLQNW